MFDNHYRVEGRESFEIQPPLRTFHFSQNEFKKALDNV